MVLIRNRHPKSSPGLRQTNDAIKAHKQKSQFIELDLHEKWYKKETEHTLFAPALL